MFKKQKLMKDIKKHQIIADYLREQVALCNPTPVDQDDAIAKFVVTRMYSDAVDKVSALIEEYKTL